ncbi:uncharacterized protein L969DRAFT_87905 [Mixia osmundae IAM 14324]|uniref:Uncharacterized protein n=1 Tax=Mixia osmundae (strain CBS 9802 / IAM 14324 / JCM 22182 / KY 12970) TaxID=764103 RepID=G7E228_MIXOS|nr:uncharacterized protein L969DRAFT_87905 [Mixia osmundae IAM 14324]KEI38677.1 hypothetical protein L969DRAFT_87905 [Mixia osmundae IAM 14324]GAA96865.1 hypothetical protein E5Q_03538 [Mixia osmundae IAM 14324]
MDTAIYRQREIDEGISGQCGRTLADGPINIAEGIRTATDENTPAFSAQGEMPIKVDVVNEDGAGPFDCDVSEDGGQTFRPCEVVTQVPGKNGKDTFITTEYPLVLKVNAPNCRGGPQNNICLVRSRNTAPNGPFVACFAAMNAKTPNAEMPKMPAIRKIRAVTPGFDKVVDPPSPTTPAAPRPAAAARPAPAAGGAGGNRLEKAVKRLLGKRANPVKGAIKAVGRAVRRPGANRNRAAAGAGKNRAARPARPARAAN